MRIDNILLGLIDMHPRISGYQLKAIINDYCSKPENTLIMVSHYEEELPKCINKRMELQ